MRKAWGSGRRAVIVALLAGFAAGAGVAAQQNSPQEKLPTVEQVLNRYVAALGGRAALEKVESRISSGTFEVPEDSLSGTVTFYAKAPNKRRYTIDVPGFGQIDQCFDGATGWASNPQTGLRDLGEVETAQERVAADFYSALHIRSAYTELRVRGKEMVGERPAFVLEGRENTGGPRVMYFDAESGLMVRVTVDRDSPDGRVTVENYLDDYREVDGVKLPHLLTQVQPGLHLLTRITEVKSNALVEDSVFAKPTP